MTDTELDALVKRMDDARYRLSIGIVAIQDVDALADVREAITTLRAQLAEAQAELRITLACNRGLVRLNEATQDRADRAEAERDAALAAQAAQIEADAGVADGLAALCGSIQTYQNAVDVKCGCGQKASAATRDRHAEERDLIALFSAIKTAAAAIRSQPHARTALDRMRRAEREKALRDVLGLRRYDPGYDERAECVTMDDVPDGDWISADAIIAMVKQDLC